MPSSAPRIVRSSTARSVIVRIPVTPAVAARLGQMASADNAKVSSSNEVATTVPSSSVVAFGGTNVLLSQLLNPAPGLGFDYTHLAALNQDLGERALVDPVTQQELALTERLIQETPTEPVSYGLFGAAPVIEAEQQQPQVIVLEQPAPAAAPSISSRAPEPSPHVQPHQPPLPDAGEFILVLRNGEQVKAVAFSHQKDQIVYITEDGKRRSFPDGELNAAATEKINDENGTPVQLPL